MTDSSPYAHAGWPDVNVAGWAATKKSLHLYAQMLGKLRLALAPPQPNWVFTSLALTARGLTTGTMPWRGTSVQASIDIFASEIIVERSTGDVPGRVYLGICAPGRRLMVAHDMQVISEPFMPQKCLRLCI